MRKNGKESQKDPMFCYGKGSSKATPHKFIKRRIHRRNLNTIEDNQLAIQGKYFFKKLFQMFCNYEKTDYICNAKPKGVW